MQCTTCIQEVIYLPKGALNLDLMVAVKVWQPDWSGRDGALVVKSEVLTTCGPVR